MNRFKENSPVLVTARLVLAFSWIYQGAVPKLICRSPGEIELLEHVIKVNELACTLIVWMGYGEVLFGFLLLFTSRSWVFLLNILALVILLGYVAVFQPELFTLPFNPLILNVSLIGMSLIAYGELRKNNYRAER
ncbi:DoxX-like family protein [Prosthecochloris sp.]|uniref:DoxX-like family protein n=1 Tax=Prosthecochloris sp. TaxID=290513 RepID=UPI0025CF2B03|nr:DoxX-like family protein [Prosthecochloris sp.]